MLWKIFTKKNILFGSGLLSLILFVMNYIGTFSLCGGKEYGSCMDTTSSAMLVFLPAFPLFFISILVCFLKENTYRTWLKFALVWVPLTMLCTAAAPEYSQSLMPVVKGSVAFSMSALFVIISLFIIFATYVCGHDGKGK